MYSFENAVIDIVVDEFRVPAHAIDAEARLTVDLGVDSIDRLALAVRIENEFDIALQDETVHRLQTVGDLVQFVDRKVTGQPA